MVATVARRAGGRERRGTITGNGTIRANFSGGDLGLVRLRATERAFEPGLGWFIGLAILGSEHVTIQ